MAIHCSILVWEVPWTEEPGRLHSPWGHETTREFEVAEKGDSL